MVRFSHIQATKRFFVDLGHFLLVVVGGTSVVLIGSQFVGYLPYSDRPGPGWIGWFPVRSFKEAASVVGFGLSFATLCIVPASIYGAVLILMARLLEWLKIRRWIVAVSCALLAGFLSQLVIGGVGWLIAIGRFPVAASAVLGIAFGGWVLPRKPVRVLE